MVLPGPGQQRTALLASFAQRDIDTTVKVATDKIADGRQPLGLRPRPPVERRGVPRQRAHGDDGAVFIAISRVVGSTETTIGTEALVTGLTHTAGQSFWVRIR